MATDVKPRSNRLLMVLGIVLAVVAFLLVLLLGGGNKSGGAGTGSRTKDVVVAMVDIPAQTAISEQLLKVVKFADDQLPLGYISVIKCPPKPPAGGCTDAIGQFAAVTIPKGAILSSNVLVSTLADISVPKPVLAIPSGQVALPIPAGGELQAAAGFIQPGDKVDILEQPAGSTPGLWKITVQNLVIQRVGPLGSPNTQGLSSSYMVYVTPQDAEYLSYLFANGTYKYLLRSQKDHEDNTVVSTTGVGQKEFFQKYNLPAAAK
ncbi:MAG: CpaB family protein [Candidatus Dormibacteria bacterium]